MLARIRHVVRPHSHDAGDKVDAPLEASAEGIRALWISLAVLGMTAVIQAIVVVFSGSVALLGDTLHNGVDALTAVPLGVAFVIGRRPANRRYTYGYGRAEDLAGLVIIVFIAASSALAAYEAVDRLAHPRPVSNLAAVAVAAGIGFAGNELVARYRIRVGRKIGSPATPSSTASEVNPSVRACRPSATRAAEPIFRPTRIRYRATSSLPVKPAHAATATAIRLLTGRG